MRRQRTGVDRELKKEPDDSEESQSVDDETNLNNGNGKRRRRKRRRTSPDEEIDEVVVADSSNYPVQSLNGQKKRRSLMEPILYTPNELLPDLENCIGSDVIVHVLPQYLTIDNEQVKSCEIYGSGPYAYESDLVRVLQHHGIYKLTSEVPNFAALQVTLQVLPGGDSYEESEKNNVKSKALESSEISITPIEVDIIRDPDQVIQSKNDRRKAHTVQKVNGNNRKNGSTSTNQGVVTATHRGRGRRPKKILEEIDTVIAVDIWADTFLQFNLSNELWGIDHTQWTSYRFKKAVLMLENGYNRYELSRQNSQMEYDCYRFAKVLKPSTKNREWYSKNPVPLQDSEISIIEDSLDWSQVVWAKDSVKIKSVTYPIRTLCWVAHCNINRSPSVSDESQGEDLSIVKNSI